MLVLAAVVVAFATVLLNVEGRSIDRRVVNVVNVAAAVLVLWLLGVHF